MHGKATDIAPPESQEPYEGHPKMRTGKLYSKPIMPSSIIEEKRSNEQLSRIDTKTVTLNIGGSVTKTTTRDMGSGTTTPHNEKVVILDSKHKGFLSQTNRVLNA